MIVDDVYFVELYHCMLWDPTYFLELLYLSLFHDSFEIFLSSFHYPHSYEEDYGDDDDDVCVFFASSFSSSSTYSSRVFHNRMSFIFQQCCTISIIPLILYQSMMMYSPSYSISLNSSESSTMYKLQSEIWGSTSCPLLHDYYSYVYVYSVCVDTDYYKALLQISLILVW